MLTRLDHPTEGQSFSAELCEEIGEILSFVYAEKASAINRAIEVYGMIYDTEVILAVSLVDPHNELEVPVTYQASVEIAEEARYEKVLDAIVDSAGLFFEQYFSDSDWDDYNGNWTQIEVKGVSVHYISTRENIKLSMQADALLREH